MGYDMYWVETPPEVAEAAKEAERAWRAAIDERDKFPRESMHWDIEADRIVSDDPAAQAAADKAHELYDAMHRAEANYFRLNLHWMGRWRSAMVEVGMVFLWAEPDFDWPKEYELVERLGPEKGAEEAQRLREVITKEHGPEIPGIPIWKFCTNDGWWVLPGEITAALRAWQEKAGELSEATAEVVTSEYWEDWLTFLRGAAEHEGFLVR